MARAAGSCHFLISIGSGFHPGWAQRRDPRLNRTVCAMGARQIAEAHQELAGDLATREGEGAAEQLHPFHLRQRMVGVEPSLEAAMTVAKQAYAASVFNRRVDLKAVAYDFGIAEQTCPIL